MPLRGTRRVRAVHDRPQDPQLQPGTYGRPRTCDRLLATACNKSFKQRLFRFVTNNDIVPQLPPEPAYTHVEPLRYIDADGRIREAMSFFGGLADKAKGLTADAFAPASDGVRDHSIHRYSAALEKNLR